MSVSWNAGYRQYGSELVNVDKQNIGDTTGEVLSVE